MNTEPKEVDLSRLRQRVEQEIETDVYDEIGRRVLLMGSKAQTATVEGVTSATRPTLQEVPTIGGGSYRLSHRFGKTERL